LPQALDVHAESFRNLADEIINDAWRGDQHDLSVFIPAMLIGTGLTSCGLESLSFSARVFSVSSPSAVAA
jgi:hypothetical protein